jgi:hypothetical protein
MKIITRGLMAIVLCYCLVLQGCSLAWIGTLDTILAAAAPALNNVLTIVALASGKPVNQVLEDKITQDAANLKTLAKDFANALPANQPTACQELQAGVNILNDDSAIVLSIVQSLGPAGGNLPAIFAAADAFVISIVALIPSCKAPAALRLSIPKAVAAIDANKLVSTYNAVLVVPSGKANVDNYAKSHKIHAHSKLVRILSMGREK